MSTTNNVVPNIAPTAIKTCLHNPMIFFMDNTFQKVERISCLLCVHMHMWIQYWYFHYWIWEYVEEYVLDRIACYKISAIWVTFLLGPERCVEWPDYSAISCSVVLHWEYLPLISHPGKPSPRDLQPLQPLQPQGQAVKGSDGKRQKRNICWSCNHEPRKFIGPHER